MFDAASSASPKPKCSNPKKRKTETSLAHKSSKPKRRREKKARVKDAPNMKVNNQAYNLI